MQSLSWPLTAGKPCHITLRQDHVLMCHALLLNSPDAFWRRKLRSARTSVSVVFWKGSLQDRRGEEIRISSFKIVKYKVERNESSVARLFIEPLGVLRCSDCCGSHRCTNCESRIGCDCENESLIACQQFTTGTSSVVLKRCDLAVLQDVSGLNTRCKSLAARCAVRT